MRRRKLATRAAIFIAISLVVLRISSTASTVADLWTANMIGSILFAVLKFAILTLCFVAWLFAAHLWLRTITAFGFPRRSLLRRIWALGNVKVYRRGEPYILIAFLLTAGALILHGAWLGHTDTTYLGIQMLGAFGGTLVFMSVPPVVVLLGGSSPRRFLFQAQIAEALRPLRVVSSMDPMYGWPGATDWGNIFRTRDSTNWQSSAFELIDITPIVVLDTRQDSLAVRTEALHLLASSKRRRKTLFVVGEQGERPVLDHIGLNKSNRKIRDIGLIGEAGAVDLLRTWARLSRPFAIRRVRQGKLVRFE